MNKLPLELQKDNNERMISMSDNLTTVSIIALFSSPFVTFFSCERDFQCVKDTFDSLGVWSVVGVAIITLLLTWSRRVLYYDQVKILKKIKENTMKTLSCDMCEATFDAETFEEWFQQMMPHYMAEHADFMEASKNKTKEDGEKWMAAAKQRFEDA